MNIKQLKKQIVPTLRREGVQKAGIFGSVARGEQGASSDIDLLVQMQPGKTLYDLVGLKIALEEKLGRTVDIVTYKSLHPRLRNTVLREQTVIYEKRS